jgi:NAD(P)-dependent dehydrogenase (short-subunit alcohol dehydrogenase family)
MEQHTIVVTGASSGIGRASAIALAGRGFRVLAGVREEADGEALRGAAPPKAEGVIESLRLDVTDAAQIEAARERAAELVGETGLWGLFNNAGISVNGPIEFLEPDDLRRQLEVNVVGQVAVTRAFLPLLRRARGRVVTTGSIAGFFALPGLAPYCMSKYAMEAFSDALRREVRPWGIEVSLLEPGEIATDIWRKGAADADRMVEAAPGGLIEHYGPLIGRLRELATESDRHATSAEVVAREVVHAFTARRPKTRYRMGKDSTSRKWVSRLPDRWADSLVARLLRWR